MKFRNNPEENEDENEDEMEEELGGLLNWPPSRGAIDPNLPRKTFLPSVERDTAPGKLKVQPAAQPAVGSWKTAYRVSTVRSLNLDQSDRLLHMASTEEGRYSFWQLGHNRPTPTFYVDMAVLPTWNGEFSLPKPYRLIIQPLTVKAVFTKSGGKLGKTREYETSSQGYVLYILAKELERVYLKHGLSNDFSDLYFRTFDVLDTGEIIVGYDLHKTPKEIALAELPNITRTVFSPDGSGEARPLSMTSPLPEPAKLSRSNARRIRACGLVGRWGTDIPDIVTVATLTLQQAHEILYVHKDTIEEIRKGHPRFEEMRDRSLARQLREIPFLEAQREDEEHSEGSGELGSIIAEAMKQFPEAYEDDDDNDEVEIMETVRFRCPFCGRKRKFRYEECGEVIDNVEQRHAYCDKCRNEWHEPKDEIYARRYTSSFFQNWSKCRATDAPTLVMEITYPINKLVRIAVPPANFETELGTYQIMSPGYLMWVLAKEYRHIYENHEEYGVWGHGISDLVIELIDVSDDGNANIFIGS